MITFGIPHHLPLPASVPQGPLVWSPGAHASPPASVALWPSRSAHSTPAVVLSSTSFSGQTVKGSAAADKPPAPAQGHRLQYVVITCTLAATYHDRRRGATEAASDEAEWRIALRRADQREGVSGTGAPQMRYVYWVVQPAAKPAPCHPGGILDLDPRLVDVEPA